MKSMKKRINVQFLIVVSVAIIVTAAAMIGIFYNTFKREIMENLKDDDILIITSDHGNDPTTPSTDHSREYVPMLIYGKNIKENVNLGTRKTFADIGATVADILNVSKTKNGTSFKNEVIK